MSDLESFIPSEQSEGFDAAAFERFKEQVKKGAAAAAKQQKQEAKRKKKEDKLVAILLKFIANQRHKGQLFLIAKLLEENIPPLFVLSIVILGMEDVRNEIEAVKKEEKMEAAKELGGPAPEDSLEMKLALPDQFAQFTLPLLVKGEVDLWVKGMYEAGLADAVTILEKATNQQGAIKQIVIDCAANVMSDYFEDRQGLPQMPYDSYYNFCALVMKNLFTHMKRQTKNQKQIETGSMESE